MKNIFLILAVLAYSIAATGQNHTSPNGAFAIENSYGSQYETHTINVSGVTNIRITASCSVVDYGFAHIQVMSADYSTNYGMLTLAGSGLGQYDSDQDYIYAPSNCVVMLQASDVAVAAVDYNSLYGTPEVRVTSHSISTAGSPMGLEHNLLFNATHNYSVSATGGISVDQNLFFDGSLGNIPISSGVLSSGSPYVLTIDNIPTVQPGGTCYFGFVSEGNPPSDFIIEGGTSSNWNTLAVGENNSQTNYLVEVNEDCEKFVIRINEVPNGSTIGISELVFINPASTTPYQGLFLPVDAEDITLSGTLYQETETGIRISDLSDKLVFKATASATEIHAAGSGGTQIKGDDGTTHITVLDNGYVGIGTENPGSSLAVDGSILANEVIITTDVTSYPDFVFSNDYKLLSLEDLQSFIIVNGHLPDIPTAYDAHKHGIKLAEQNKLLLRKIEELTLYLIQANQRMDEMQHELEFLKETKDQESIIKVE